MDSLPHLESIFNDLRRGYHFTPEDGEIFRPLWNRFDEYKRLFNSLGLDLRKHPQNVVYLVANDNVQPGKQARKMGLFMMVLIEHFGETHSSIVPSLFDAVFQVEKLPHLKKARYEEYMNAIGVHDASDLEGIVRSLIRFGFAEERDNGFTFRRATYRFLDLCREASTLGEKDPDDEKDSSPGGKPSPSSIAGDSDLPSTNLEDELQSAEPEEGSPRP